MARTMGGSSVSPAKNEMPDAVSVVIAGVVGSTSGHAIDPDIGVFNFVLSARPKQDPLRATEDLEAAE